VAMQKKKKKNLIFFFFLLFFPSLGATNVGPGPGDNMQEKLAMSPVKKH
jgi:hypothetical protein